MTFRLGLVGLCTSHPQTWVPIIRDLVKEGLVDLEVTAAWDSGETHLTDRATAFCKDFNIPNAIQIPDLKKMVDLVDGVLVYTANWDKHVEQARPFVEAGKTVYLDKPVVGNMKDVDQLLDWEKQGKRIFGGSSVRFAYEVRDWHALPEDVKGTPHTVFCGCASDEFNYASHAYSDMLHIMGPGVRSVRYLGMSGQKHVQIKWKDGKIGYMSIGFNEGSIGLPHHHTIITNTNVFQHMIDTSKIYRALLERLLPWMVGKVDQLMPVAEMLEPELAAMAARMSWMNNGAEIFLTDLRLDDPGYDGNQFGRQYRRGRLGPNA